MTIDQAPPGLLPAPCTEPNGDHGETMRRWIDAWLGSDALRRRWDPGRVV